MKILAVDYGDSRTGLATCDRTEFLTTAITPQITLKARNKVAARVCEVAKEIGAELIVIGLPLNMDGTEGERAIKSRKLAKTVEIWSGLPVRMWDERQTTCAAADLLDESGKVVGTHNGAVRYTIGQRKGLGLAMGAPVYVCGKDMQANTVTVGPEEMLFDRIVYADEVNWIAIPELTEPLRELYVMAYSLPSIAAYLYKSTTKRLQVIFGPYLPEAQPKDFYEMEIASGSIMRGFMSVPCDVYFTMEAKISRFLDCSLKLYDVPKEKRAAITAAVLQMDLHTMALGIIQKTVQQAEKGFEALTEKQI